MKATFARAALPLVALLAPACDPAAVEGGIAPEFELEDINPNSATAGEVISPSDFRGQISAWYFTHTT